MSSQRNVTTRSNYGDLSELRRYLASAIFTFQNLDKACFLL